MFGAKPVASTQFKSNLSNITEVDYTHEPQAESQIIIYSEIKNCLTAKDLSIL